MSDNWPVDHRTHLSGECWRSHHDCAIAEVERLRQQLSAQQQISERLATKVMQAEAAVQAVRDLPVHWASLTTGMKSNLKTGFASVTVTQAVVRKFDIDAALGGERPPCTEGGTVGGGR